MTDEPEQRPIIVKKIKKSHGGHGGAWKVAYADFVTAMMALFIVLWVMGQDEDVLEAVASYFKDPIGFSNKSGSYWDGKNKNLINPNTLDEKMLKEAEKKKLEELSTEMMKELNNDEEFKELLDQIEVKIVKEGLRIELIDSEKDLFFEIGTSKLNSKAEAFLNKIGGKIVKLPNKIVVEGHTDSRPYTGNGAGYSNFELSTERANSARRALLLGGLTENQFEEVRGYADRILKDSDDPFNAINRRISIIIKYAESDLKTTPLSEVNGLQEP
jgi:chemotaxis protein MotB